MALRKPPHPNQHNVRAWEESARDRPKLPRTKTSLKKFHIIVGLTFRAQHYFEVLNAGESVNSERYVAFLQNILQLRRQNLTIMHDNARPHVSQLTSAFMASKNITRVHQPPYSPDMNLCDIFIFRNMEIARLFIQ